MENALREWTTFGIGGTARRLTVASSRGELIDLAPNALVIGRGSNILVSDRGYDGHVVINRYDDISRDGCAVTVGSGTSLAKLCGYLESEGLTGMEWALGIPASVGGAVKMNAGAFGSCIADRLISAEVLVRGKLQRRYSSELEFSYRHSGIGDDDTVVSATFALRYCDPRAVNAKGAEYVRLRSSRQPKGKSAGSVFKNPQGMYIAKLIDDAGLKGTRVGGAIVSPVHANIIVNTGGATARDVCELIRTIKRELLDRYGVSAQEEIIYIGDMG